MHSFKVLTLVLLFALVIPAVVPLQAQGVVEITFAYHDTVVETPWYLAQIETANGVLEREGLNIRIVGVPVPGSWVEYHQKFLAQLAAGRSPDIWNIAESEMPSIIEGGQALDLTPYLEGFDTSAYFESTFKSAGYKDGRYYGLPSSLYYLVMYYNKDLFDQAGLEYPSADWEDPITFDELRDLALQLTQGEGGDKIWGLYVVPYMGYAGMYARANGGTGVAYEDKTCALTEPESLEMYNWFDTVLREDKSVPTPQDQAVIGGFDLFKAGRIAMFIDGNWFQPVFNEITDFRVGIAALPAGKSGTAYTTMFVNNWFISGGTQHEAEAWEALKALFSLESWTALAELSGGGVPIHREVYNAFVDRLLAEQFDEADRQAFVGAIDHVIPVPYDEHYAEIDNEVNMTISEWLNGEISAEEYAQRVCDTWNETWGK